MSAAVSEVKTEDAGPKCALRRRSLEPQRELLISNEAFEALVEARATLVDAHAFETKFDVLKENFISLELAATGWSLRAAIEYEHTYAALSSILRDANRHVMNLLTAARTYVDQVVQDFSHLASAGFQRTAKELLSAAYDACFEYRFMEALRNHAQHRGEPVQGYSGSIAGGSTHWVDTVVIRTSKASLIEGGKFKASVLTETPNIVDVREAARRYVERLSDVHVALRAIVTPTIDKARALIEGANHDYLEAGNDGALGLAAVRLLNGQESEVVPLLLDWDDVRKRLASVNATPIRLGSDRPRSVPKDALR